MTEQEWLKCSDLAPMLKSLHGSVSDRKLRLFACECVKRILHLLPSDLCRSAVSIAEQYADGLATVEQLRNAGGEAHYSSPQRDYPHNVVTGELARSAVDQLTEHENDAWSAVYGAYRYAIEAVGGQLQASNPIEEQAQCHLLRDIFGNPFRSVIVDRSWLTSTVTALAEGIYADRAFDRIPILADALQDAGCDSADILGHCRGDGPHVRGCWVIDLLLGKE
ncbi:Uncharacterized protein OS=Sorangium cellulosum (strain So ce56) GN=sce5710 PE=4 SV=1 [Gemmata massiliana]|uniref:SMI1/KNR4 family protein n=1 Tax=Gemmata massiliana TaxID=1210884 RepID=A0A6P2CUE8_9BACT|nr:hypothetical protein [Gemmata massiliana]VTR91775.1 Uncharacterized protein OS=Sorangium cellulosum (strain So ce56) GN=sce5710 PE=4 SV=1 [Gemmata massiliana]